LIPVGRFPSIASSPIPHGVGSSGSTSGSGGFSIAERSHEIEGPSPTTLASAIADLRSALEAHFAYEERHWLPFLGGDLPFGRERADEMLAEHNRQRDFVADLDREASACPGAPELVSDLTFLAAWLLSHMAEEERCLVLLSVRSGDDFILVAQQSG
jgi:hemerythrin HHE cation binding domain-containing protein